jgi:hypothetical protein
MDLNPSDRDLAEILKRASEATSAADPPRAKGTEFSRRPAPSKTKTSADAANLHEEIESASAGRSEGQMFDTNRRRLETEL